MKKEIFDIAIVNYDTKENKYWMYLHSINKTYIKMEITKRLYDYFKEYKTYKNDLEGERK